MRTTRAQSTRSSQTRGMQARKAPEAQERDALWLPTPPPGMRYGWIRRAVLGMEDAYNIRERQLQGWKPVPADRHPEMQPEGWGLVLGEAKGYIENAGLIMCECPEQLLRKRQDLLNELNRSRVQGKNFELDPRSKIAAPTFDDSKTGFERVVTERVNDDAEFKE